jgi:proline dehydrogenase
MLRNTLLYLSNQPGIFKFVRDNSVAKSFASRFVAGETVHTAIDAVRRLNAKGITASLDLLGESTTNEQEAYAAQREYLQLLDLIAREKLDANVSLKLTAMGMDISDALCVKVTREILERAKSYNNFVRLDMESSAYTQKTLDLFSQHFYPDFRANVGIVLQSYLYRTVADAERAATWGARVRICKGAYKEPADVAFPEKSDVDASYVKAMHHLLAHGNYPGIATHDEAIIAEARRFAKEKGIASDRFEFQMLYGVRRDLQEGLVRDGYRVRCYVPFGTQWYPYLMRRLAERPANVAFMAGNVVREWFGPRRSA